MGLEKFKYSSSPIVRLNRGEEMTAELVMQLVRNAKTHDMRYDTLTNYYTGNHDILYRSFTDSSKPNNKIVNNFASYITDVRTGYFTGIPLGYQADNLKMLRDLQAVLVDNSSDDVTNELDRLTNIHGHAFELFWVDEEGDVRFKQVPANQMIMVYSSDVSEKPLYAIRHYVEQDIYGNGTLNEYIFVYDSQLVTEYRMYQDANTDKYVIEGVSQYPHLFPELPVIEYMNNADRLSCFEDVISLIDSYNVTESDSVNEVQYFNDAYLKLKNLSDADELAISDMKNNRVILLEGDGDAEWLTKQINDTYLEHLKERIAKDIHKFSKTPNLVSDDFVSNLSGTAIRYKVWGLEQDTASKERKWRRALKKRIRLIFHYLGMKGQQYDETEVELVFNRNMPQNVMELGQMASQLNGIVSNETILGQIPFVENVALEMDRLDKERESKMDLFGLPVEGGTVPEDNAVTSDTATTGQADTTDEEE